MGYNKTININIYIQGHEKKSKAHDLYKSDCKLNAYCLIAFSLLKDKKWIFLCKKNFKSVK